MKRMLFLTTELPYPLDNGGKIRTYNMIKGLSGEYNIDVVCFSELEDNTNSIKELKEICNNVYVFKKLYTNSKSKSKLIRNVLSSTIKNIPFIVGKFSDNGYREKVEMLLGENNYNCILVDHLQVAQFVPEKYLLQAVLSQHNCEYLILKRMAQESSNYLKKVYVEYESRKLEKYEKKMCSQFKKVVLLSEEDKKFLIGKEYNGENSFILPISVEMNFKKKNINSEKKNILFLGTMSWLPNEQGVLWFLENVWHHIKNYGYKLYIVGKNPSDSIKKFEDSNVVITGYVDDINEYIELCDFSIVPLFIGGGMRVKILECMAKNMPIISTTIGAEGIEAVDDNNILIADTVDEFINKIKKIQDENIYNKIRQSATKLIEEKYSISAVNNQLINILSE
ncbi:glycosyltransferase [Clostridium sp. NSJ-6]|uniref:Glycosyltransferase n=1 Tax=Clostridium hominis TaxID=2763036 RepID=A0ABR7D9K9_9CLOT|nr:glycosyltransferase [Clostridium hominis]MBC5628074.1 glycosyltransferase [Clostridium hominis]